MERVNKCYKSNNFYSLLLAFGHHQTRFHLYNAIINGVLLYDHDVVIISD
jgi:hypothetical protein